MIRRVAYATMMFATIAASAAADETASSKAFKEADHTMMKAMRAAPMTGDADKDFAMMMIPHHQGAVDMAKIELQYGKDPELRNLAEAIVQAQEKEIAQMETWRAAHP